VPEAFRRNEKDWLVGCAQEIIHCEFKDGRDGLLEYSEEQVQDT